MSAEVKRNGAARAAVWRGGYRVSRFDKIQKDSVSGQSYYSRK